MSLHPFRKLRNTFLSDSPTRLRGKKPTPAVVADCNFPIKMAAVLEKLGIVYLEDALRFKKRDLSGVGKLTPSAFRLLREYLLRFGYQIPQEWVTTAKRKKTEGPP